MLAFLDGSASTFEIERVRSHTSLELVLTRLKRVFLLFRNVVHGDSIGGCPKTGLDPQSVKRMKGANKGATFLD
jgi:hypothetical protein